MNFARQTQLQYLIAKCGEQLKKLQPHLDFSDITNVMYNKILIEKAIYKAELKEVKPSFFRKLLKSVKSIGSADKYYICDYFK